MSTAVRANTTQWFGRSQGTNEGLMYARVSQCPQTFALWLTKGTSQCSHHHHLKVQGATKKLTNLPAAVNVELDFADFRLD